jgi:hypothetical protein
LSSKHPLGIHITFPYVIQMCKLFEDQNKIQEIFDIVDRCEIGLWLDGGKLAESLNIPVTVVGSIFSLYELNGYGVTSKENGTCKYFCIA